MKKYSLLLASLLLGFLSTACVTPYSNPHMQNLIPESEYEMLSEKFSDNEKIYDGFLQTMEVSVTLLNTSVSYAQLDQKARIYQWTPEQYASHKAEMEASLSKETKFFFGFFVPERKHDDLHKSKTLWKVFVDVGGKRYEGKVERIKTIVADVQSLYPKHNRFFTPYIVTINAPVSQIEYAASKMILTGPVGNTSLDFPAATAAKN